MQQKIKNLGDDVHQPSHFWRHNAAQWKNANILIEFTCFYEVIFLYSLGIVECCIPSKLRKYLLDYM